MDEALAGHAIRWRGACVQQRKLASPVAAYLENRMRDKLWDKAAPAKLANHQVDQERHVVVDDIDCEEVHALERALPQDNLGLARRADAEAFEGAGREQGQRGRIVGLKLPGIHAGEQFFGEARGKLAGHVRR